MYTFTDRGDRSLTLRPGGHGADRRAYLEHGLHREPQPVKLYTIAPMYRYAAPQKGRYREHWQLSVEAIGSDDPAIDAEVIQLYTELLRRLGIDASTSCSSTRSATRNCRPAYVERLDAWLDEHADELDEEARQKRATSPLRVFDVKNQRCARRSPTRRRSASRSATRAASTSTRCGAYLDAYGVAVHARPDARPRPRLLHAHGLRVRRAGATVRAAHDLRAADATTG